MLDKYPNDLKDRKFDKEAKPTRSKTDPSGCLGISYHLEGENRNNKHYLVVNKKLIAERPFETLKQLATTGRLFFREKKVVIDPFSTYDIYFEGRRESSEKAHFTAYWKLGSQRGPLEQCEWVFAADPAWILKEGIIRKVSDDIAGKWLRSFAFTLEGKLLLEFLEDAPIEWKADAVNAVLEPMPFLVLADRHGGFADLWFDYGAFGKIAAHDVSASFRNGAAEKGWEKDLLETDFIKKTVEKSHYYCPLDKVAKSLTFLLEIGWSIFDARGKKVLREQRTTLDADVSSTQVTLRAKVHYDTHEVDLHHLVGAFNRREQFVELSPKEVALLDHGAFVEQWGDLADQEVTSEGISLPKNRFGLLGSLLDQDKIPLKEDLRQKIARLTQCTPAQSASPGAGFKGELFPYQKEGLQWLRFLEEGGFGGLLADEMGLGKTVQVLAFFSQMSLEKPILIVVPTSLLFNWQREMEKFLPALQVYRHEGKDRLRTLEELGKQRVILTSYALLRLDADLLQQLDYHVVVLDEAQAIKNADSQIAECCCRLRSTISLAITGTPIENRLDDLWSIFRFLQPDLLGEKAQFQAAGQQTHSLAKIKKKVRPFLLRRTKQQVCIDLPPKIEQTVYVEMKEEQRQIYDRWLQNTKQGLLKKVSLDGAASHRMEILEAILRLRQLCAHPLLVEESPLEICGKFERLMADLQEVVEEKQKVLVYSQFTSMLGLMATEIKKQGWKYVYLDGSTKNREEVVRQFQEDPEVSIFLISLKAGGVGLNLTAADYVFLYDPWWNDAAERQAIDRAHRLGKTGTVIARRYVTALSIEEKIMHLKAHKTALSQHILEAEDGFSPASIEDLLALLS